MAMSSITVKGITPNLNILGDYQRFVYIDNVSSFKTDNIFVPTDLIVAQTNWEMRNSQLSGFRWSHITNNTDTFGSLTLQSFVNADPTGSDFLTFRQDGKIVFNASLGDDLDAGNSRIINLLNPSGPQHATTQSWVQSYVEDLLAQKAFCYINMINNDITTNITTENVYVKVAGNTTLVESNLFTSSVSNRITYTGSSMILVYINITLDKTDTDTGNRTFTLFKNGTIISSISPITSEPVSAREPLSISGVVSVTTDDYLELWVTSSVNDTNILVQNLNFVVYALI